MILIHHGQTEFNRVYSETRRDPGIGDPRLTALGRRQAAAVAQALQPHHTEAWCEIVVVTHWSFIKAVAGLDVPNGAALQIDPTQPDRAAEPLYLPDTG